jgi:hypothetical protein
VSPDGAPLMISITNEINSPYIDERYRFMKLVDEIGVSDLGYSTFDAAKE